MTGVDPLPVAQELHVISDLHLGGGRNFQMFGAGKALEQYIDGLPGEPCWLVINGDFVDFLAERPSKHFDPDGAVRKLERIAGDASFKPVFQALQRFLAVPGHRVGIVLGNHDVELALPWVQARLTSLLAGGDEAADARIVYSLRGEGLLLRLGSPAGPRVLCVHGNEVDAWNVVNHERVRRIARDALHGQALEQDWQPNAGARMVVEVMNDLKKEYPFVDLLKPETGAVVPLLVAMNPSAASRLAALSALAARMVMDAGRMSMGYLGEVDSERPPSANTGFDAAGAPANSRYAQASSHALSVALLDRVEQRLRLGSAPGDLVHADGAAEYLGPLGAGLHWARGNLVEAAREQLEALERDRSFDYGHEDSTYKSLNARIASDIEFVVAGHTHLARAIVRRANASFYFNTGTWARVFRVDDGTRRDKQAFATLFAALKSASIEQLDTTPGLLAVLPHVAAFTRDATGQVAGELRQVRAQPYQVIPVPQTQFCAR